MQLLDLMQLASRAYPDGLRGCLMNSEPMSRAETLLRAWLPQGKMTLLGLRLHIDVWAFNHMSL